MRAVSVGRVNFSAKSRALKVIAPALGLALRSNPTVVTPNERQLLAVPKR